MSEPPSYFLNLLLAEGDASASINFVLIALKIGVVLVLVAVNGFFVAAEFALVGVRRSRIETLAAAGKSSAKRLLRLLDNLNAYLSASQLGITLASLGLGWVGRTVIARMLKHRSPVSDGFAWSVLRDPFSIITALPYRSGLTSPKLLASNSRRVRSYVVANSRFTASSSAILALDLLVRER